MNSFTANMFDSIKSALKESATSATNVKADILKFTPDNQYDLRLIPNIKNPEKTFFHYYNQAWTSFCTGQYISVLSPQTFGKPDLIANTKFKLKNAGTDEEKRKADTIRRAENWLVNVYVVNDPTAPENNGHVKIMRFGKQLHKIIMDCLQDTDESSVGARAFDLTENGCNFRVKVDRQGDFPSYVTSKFLLPTALPAGVDAESILEQIHDLESVFTLKTDDEMRQVMDEHFYCDAVETGATNTPSQDVNIVDSSNTSHSRDNNLDLDEDVSFESTNIDNTDDKLNELLKGLDDV